MIRVTKWPFTLAWNRVSCGPFSVQSPPVLAHLTVLSRGMGTRVFVLYQISTHSVGMLVTVFLGTQFARPGSPHLGQGRGKGGGKMSAPYLAVTASNQTGATFFPFACDVFLTVD